jgi:hypothetical protein
VSLWRIVLLTSDVLSGWVSKEQPTQRDENEIGETDPNVGAINIGYVHRSRFDGKDKR